MTAYCYLSNGVFLHSITFSVTSFSNIVSSSYNPPSTDYAFPNMPPKVIDPPVRVATNIFTFNLSSSDDN